MSQLEIRSFVLGMVATNCYLAINKETKEALIIDPADNAPRIARELDKAGAHPVAILLTHGHFDHILAVDDLRDKYRIPVYCHKDEEEVLEKDALNMASMIGRLYSTKADVLLRDEEQLKLAGFDIIVFHTPGHTKGGVCYYLPEEQTLFSGDTLFCGSVGRTDFPTGSMITLIRSVKEKLFVLPDDVRVYPGHDMETSIGYEKRYNPFIV